MSEPESGTDRKRSAGAPARLVLSFLGPPRVTVEGQVAVSAASKKVLALLAFLALGSGRPHPRELLATLFWPDQSPQRAQQNLRQVLARLKRAIEPAGAAEHGRHEPYIVANGHDVRFNPRSDYWLDVEAFVELLRAADEHPHRRLEACPRCIRSLERAVAMYRGAFLEGLSVAGCSHELDEWMVLEREQLAMRATSAMHSVANARLARRDAEGAREAARELLGMEPWNEAALRLMMRAIAVSDGRNAALQYFAAFSDSLGRELDVSPEDATLRLVDQLRSDAAEDIAFRDAGAHIPVAPTPLVGREDAIEHIERLLAGRDERLVTIHGPGGIGKTRVALEVAERQAPLWSDGVWFVPLADVEGDDELLAAVAKGLGIAGGRGQLDSATIIDHLRERELLLVLDSFEGLVDAAGLLAEVLSAAPLVKLLVTSRCRLDLRQEWLVDLGGLEVPPEAAGAAGVAGDHHAGAREGPEESRLEMVDSVRLFDQCARREVADFEITAQNAEAVSRICRLVEGLPLGLELAAAWVRLMPCDRIADEIQRSIAFLDAPRERAPRRRQSLWATFEHSYQLLEEDARRVFRRLSVFRGGFTPQAAKEVAGASPALLVVLADNSLVRTYRSGRLDSHAALREFAGEKLAADADELARTRDRHSAFYLDHVRRAYAAAAQHDTSESMAWLGDELENVRLAWDRASEVGDIDAIGGALRAVEKYYFLNGRYREGQRQFKRAADAVEATIDESEGAAGARSEPSRAWLRAVATKARLRAGEAYFASRQGKNEEVAALAEEVVTLARLAGDQVCEARGLHFRSGALWRSGDPDAAIEYEERALQLIRAVAVHESVAGGEGGRAIAAVACADEGSELERWCVNQLAGILWSQGDMRGAEEALEQMLELALRTGSRSHEAVALGNLALIAHDRGEYSLAKTRYRRSLAIYREVGGSDTVGYKNLAELCIEVGEFEEAGALLEQSLAVTRETGARRSESFALGSMALLCNCKGEHLDAERLSRQGLNIAQELSDMDAEAAAIMQLGNALVALGELHAAQQAFERAIELLHNVGQGLQAVAPAAGLAHVRMLEGDISDAMDYAQIVLPRCIAADLDGVVYRSEVQLRCFYVLRAAHDPRADEVLRSARRELLRRADAITDPRMRDSFLNRVPAHRAITELSG